MRLKNPSRGWLPAGAHAEAVVLAGAHAEAVVLAGVDASAGVSSQGDPRPVLFRITGPGLGNRYLSGMEAVEGAAVRHQEGPLLLEHLPHRLARDRRMRPLLGVLDAPIHQPRVDLGVGAAPRAGHEQAAANVTHLPLDLPLLPSQPRALHATGFTRW